jgi:hypothetical protein
MVAGSRDGDPPRQERERERERGRPGLLGSPVVVVLTFFPRHAIEASTAVCLSWDTVTVAWMDHAAQ